MKRWLEAAELAAAEFGWPEFLTCFTIFSIGGFYYLALTS